MTTKTLNYSENMVTEIWNNSENLATESKYTSSMLSSGGNESFSSSTISSIYEVETAGLKHVCITTQEISLTINIVAICVGLIIIIGNFLVLYVIFRYPSRSFTPFNWLLCHLAVADFVVGVTVFWWYGLAEVLRVPVTNFQKVGFYGASIVSVLASLEGLMTIALDRYYLILRQQRYTSTITKKRLMIAIVAMWVIPCIYELIVPLSGWSCVEDCDCRIQNVRPDDVYCFGEQCSQILPPLTKHQLFITGVISCALFVVTILLYMVIFYGVKKQSNKLKHHLSPSRTQPPKSPKTPKEIPHFQVNKPPESPRVPGWRSNLATVHEQDTPTPTQKRHFRFSNCNQAFEMDEMGDSPQQGALTIEFKGAMNRQESNTTTTTQLSYTSTPSTEILPFHGIQNQSNDPKAGTEREKNGSIPKAEVSTVKVLMRPKTLQTSNGIAEENRKSQITSIFNRLTRRGKRRTTMSRKRDLRVMQSMFIILSVFIATTGPLMLFVIYTFPHNDRDLKEIFNYLLQVTTLNSLLNPVLYFWRIPHMKKKLRKLVRANYFERKWEESSFWRWRNPGKRPHPKLKEVSEPSWESAASDASMRE